MDTLNKILTLMKQKNISNTTLAEHLNISISQISNWKSGNNTSYTKYISKIAEYLGVSTDYLLGTDQNKTASPLRDEAVELYNRISSLTPEQQAVIENLLAQFEKK